MVFVLVVSVVVIGRMHLTVDHAYADDTGLPTGIVKGATIQTANALSGLETFQVEEVKGNWVLAKVTQSQLWTPGREIWLNLGATDQVLVAK
jgi:hypothetical protein